jgi:hypothetical protein
VGIPRGAGALDRQAAATTARREATEVQPAGQRRRQGAVEGVAGAGADRLDPRRPDVDGPTDALHQDRAGRPERDEDRRGGARTLARRLEQGAGGLDRVLGAGRRASRPARVVGDQPGELAPVRHDHVRERQH